MSKTTKAATHRKQDTDKSSDVDEADTDIEHLLKRIAADKQEKEESGS